jgi:ribosomal protein S18 acetylase RimI-like enzyme
MTKPELRPFDENMISSAGRLLAQRHRRNRALMPVLPARFEDPEVSAEAVATTWKRGFSSGCAAFDGEAMVAYLFGECVVDAQRGRHVWMHLPGHALADGLDAELYRDLYAAAGSGWLERGHFDHYVMAPAGDRDAVEAFFALSFGKEQAHAICDLNSLQPSLQPASSGAWAIRQAIKADRDLLAEAAGWIPQRLAGAPVWGAMLPERLGDRRQQYAAIVDDDTATVWLAEEDGRLVGIAVYFSEEPVADDLQIGEDCATFAVGATRPGERGRGIATALTHHGLADLRAHGFRTCLTDWRVANLEASRLWPRFGFETAVYRLVRRVDPRIAWAR